MSTTLAIATFLAFLGLGITTTLSLLNKKFNKIADNYITYFLLTLLLVVIIGLIIK